MRAPINLGNSIIVTGKGEIVGVNGSLKYLPRQVGELRVSLSLVPIEEKKLLKALATSVLSEKAYPLCTIEQTDPLVLIFPFKRKLMTAGLFLEEV